MDLSATNMCTGEAFPSGFSRATVSWFEKTFGSPPVPTLSRLDMIERNNAGRWSVLTVTNPIDDPIERDSAVQTYVRVLLKRYGVIVRDIVLREELRVGWVELVRILRRMEARGEVRGGYFAEGLSGEQFALPEALVLLRETAQEPSELDFQISAADLFNLTGTLTDDREPTRINQVVNV